MTTGVSKMLTQLLKCFTEVVYMPYETSLKLIVHVHCKRKKKKKRNQLII